MYNKPKTGIREFTDFDLRVGQAWSLHIRKNYGEAVEAYRKLLDEWGDHIDANFGLALTYKGMGQASKAAEAFRKTESLIRAEIGKTADEHSRFPMLLKLVTQHLAEIVKG
ncbi:MAG TPA: hypothetical protein PLD47_18695 [Aggregatilineales bacterium]|nr:tetratricopeptide repeat protein [Anaerolineales bacterium]HRE49759.1 hypothetical protein [Aggregatilineales bacterium]